jgi:hypothetical protein
MFSIWSFKCASCLSDVSYYILVGILRIRLYMSLVCSLAFRSFSIALVVLKDIPKSVFLNNFNCYRFWAVICEGGPFCFLCLL